LKSANIITSKFPLLLFKLFIALAGYKQKKCTFWITIRYLQLVAIFFHAAVDRAVDVALWREEL
jgi:hypothetical protein